LTVNWVPTNVPSTSDPTGILYLIYSGWNIFLNLGNPPGTYYATYFTNGLGAGGTLTSRAFQQAITSSNFSINMDAVSSDQTQYLNGPEWPAFLNFPPQITSSLVSWDNSTLELGQTLTITLSGNYPSANVDGSSVSGWQVGYQDPSSQNWSYTGWMPLSNRVVTKIFSTPGTWNISVQTLNDFSNSTPPVKLMRSFAFSVFVVNQEYSAAPETSITGTLGVAGEAGFEIVDNTSLAAVPQPFEVIVRSAVRDTITNELKLLVATSRYSNASSLLGTMALDVFPFSGRPQAKELIEPLAIVTSTGIASPVKIQTASLPSNSYVGKPIVDFDMSATGGTAPYSWYSNGLPPGLKMSIDGTISGTPTQLGNFTVNVSVQDSTVPAFIAEVTYTYTIPTDLAITTTSPLLGATVLTPYSVQLQNSGGILPFTWSIQGGSFPVGLVLSPNGLLSGVPCTYETSDFSIPFSATVQVTDAVGALASQTFSISLSPAALQFGTPDQPVIFAGHNFRIVVPVFGGVPPYTLGTVTYDVSPFTTILSNGLFDFGVNVPNNNLGVHNFTVTVNDSASATATKTFYYTAATELTDILDPVATFGYYWSNGDTTSIAHEIEGPLSGFRINQGNLLDVNTSYPTYFSNPNGLVVTVNPSSSISTSPPASPPVVGPAVEVAGPPTAYGNTEVYVPIPLTHQGSVVATIVQTYSLPSHNDTGYAAGDVGVSSSYTRPYLVNGPVGLNPQRPYFNSTEIINPGTLTAVLKTGNVLPTGLSLDQVTGLIYGNLLATFGSLAGGGNTSVLEYFDSSDNVHGIITIYWDTQTTAPFSLNGALPNGTLQQAYTGTITSNSPSALTTAAVYRGHLPTGLTLGVSGTSVTLTGTPTEAGFFDLWLQATNVTGGVSYTYQRLAIEYIVPLTILTTTLANIVVGQPYSQTLQGYGGVPPYTWTWDAAVSFPALIGSISLNASTGALTGTYSGSPTGPFNVTFTLTDSDGTVTTQVIPMVVSNALAITTAAIPAIPGDNSPYSFYLTAAGGIPPYAWQPASPLPTGITFNSSGLLAGSTTDVAYGSQLVTFTVQDSTGPSSQVTKNLTVQVAINPGMVIITTGVGEIYRGVSYLGTLSLGGVTPTVPVQWTITSDVHNLFSGVGLALTPGSSNQGLTAYITGLYTGAAFSGWIVGVQAADSSGHVATANLSLTAGTNLAITSTSPLPQALVGNSYTFQFVASGGGSPTGGAPAYTWSGSMPAGFSLSSSGLLSWPSPTATTQAFTVYVADAMSPTDSVNGNFQVTGSASTLTITTSSPLAQATAGVAYNNTLAASGGTSPYTWQLVGGALPSNLNLSTSGIISGTTTSVGNFSIIVQVTDNVGSTYQKTFALTVVTGLTLHTGIDYVNSTSNLSLGEVTSLDNVTTISPRGNYSFYVVATGVIATQTSQLSATVPTGYTATVQSVSGGIAYIVLSGPFGSGSAGSNNFAITVTDVGGVNASATFTWTVYTSLGPLTVKPSSGTIPSYGIPLFEGTAGSLPIFNNGSSFVLPGPFAGTTVPPATAATGIFSLTGGGVVTFGWDGSNFKYSYAGGSLPSGVALTTATLTEQDIAWYSTANGFDLFSTGQAPTGAFLYMVDPTATAGPTSVSIPSNNTTTNTVSNFPSSAVNIPSSAYGTWNNPANVERNNGQYASTTVISNHTQYSTQVLQAMGFEFNIPSNAYNISLTITASAEQTSAFGQAVYTTVQLINGGSPIGNQWSSNGTFSWSQGSAGIQTISSSLLGVSLTPAIVNSSTFGLNFNAAATQGGGGTSVGLQLYYITISVTYTIPNYNTFTVTLSKPFSPQQQGTASGTGNSISALATMTSGVSVISTTPTYGTGSLSGWLTGWTVQAQFPSGTGTITTVLSMQVTGTLTYLSGTSMLAAQAVTYINAAVATIKGTYT
jgi:hypothetical protein